MGLASWLYSRTLKITLNHLFLEKSWTELNVMNLKGAFNEMTEPALRMRSADCLSLGSADAPERVVPEPSGMFLRFFSSFAAVVVAVVVVLPNYCGGGLTAMASARLASSLVAQVFAQPTHTRHTQTDKSWARIPHQLQAALFYYYYFWLDSLKNKIVI